MKYAGAGFPGPRSSPIVAGELAHASVDVALLGAQSTYLCSIPSVSTAPSWLSSAVMMMPVQKNTMLANMMNRAARRK